MYNIVYGFEGMNEGKKECMISRDDNEERILGIIM